VLYAQPNIDALNNYFNFSTGSNMVSSQSGLIAWVDTLAGVPNVFLFDSKNPGVAPLQVTSYTEDAGTTISNLCFSPDDYLFFNYAPIEGANSPSLTQPLVTQTLVYYKGKGAIVLTMDGSVVLTCKKSCVTVTDGMSVTDITVDQQGHVNTAVLFQLQRGNYQGYIGTATWNADGTKLAFDNYRGDHGFVGVVSTNSTRIQWLASTFHYNQNPVWSPDGKFVVFYRLRPIRNAMGLTMRLAFKVIMVELSTGNSVELFSDKDFGFPEGGRYGPRPLLWPLQNRIIFSAQISGWLHVYSVDPTTLSVVDLSPGKNCEVQDYVCSSDGSNLYMAHNCDELDSLGIKQLGLLSLQSSNIVVGKVGIVAGLTDSGFGMAPGIKDSLAFLQSTYNNSTSVMFVSSTVSTPVQISRSNNAPSSLTWVKPTVVTFPSTDSLFVLHSQLFLPSNYTPTTKYPAIVFTHGGPMRQMYPAMHFSGTYAQLYAQNQYLVSQGYVVLSINYRMGIGYGYAFEYAPECADLGAKEYLDVKAGALWLQSQSIVKIGNIGIYGLSYGGLNTLQALARDSDIFVAGVASAPVFNWISADRAGNDPRLQYMPLMPLVSLGIGPEPDLATPSWSDIVNTNMKLAYESSPAGHLDSWKSPTMVIHGDSDHSVEVQESIGLVYALEDKGDVVIESLMIPDESHGMGSYSHQLQIASATVQFLFKYVTNN